jgi:oligosaccharide repeat unit polymerase
MRLVKTYTRLPLKAMLVLVMCMTLWKTITLTSLSVKKHIVIEQKNIYKTSKLDFTVIVTGLFIVSTVSILFEWYKAGGIPAFRKDVEIFRFNTSYSAITHIFAIMNKIVATMIGIYLVEQGKLKLKYDIILFLEFIGALFLMYCTAFRGEMILAPCVIFIYYAIRHKISIKFYVIAGILAFLFIGIYPIARMYRMYGANYFAGQRGISTYPQLFFLTPIYQSFTNNFEVLNLDFSIFPKMREYGLGTYSILPQIPFVDLGRSLGAVQNEVLNNGFYANLTATYLATWYADFGYIGCFIVTILFCWLTNFSYYLCLKKNNIGTYAWYAYTFYTALWMFYSGTFDFVYICYSCLIYFAFHTKIENR